MDSLSVVSITAPITKTKSILERIKSLKEALSLVEEELIRTEDQCVLDYINTNGYLDLKPGTIIHNSSNSALYVRTETDILRIKSVIANEV